MQLEPAEQRPAQAHEANAQFAHPIDVVIKFGTFQQTWNLMHISPPAYGAICAKRARSHHKHTSLRNQPVDVNAVKFDRESGRLLPPRL